MAYTYATIEAQVRANVNDTSASVTQEIDDAINLLSNIFFLRKIDTSQSTAAGTATLNRPTRCIEVERVKIGDYEYPTLKLHELTAHEDDESRRSYEYDDKIQLLPTPTAVTAAKIWYKAGFAPLVGAGSTDIPDRLVPLLIILATWVYFAQIVAKVVSARENYPDMTPEEASKVAQVWKDSFDKMLPLFRV